MPSVYDLTSFCFDVGQIGRLKTIARYPVIAGDVYEIDLQGQFRLSPLRRNLTIDARVDMFAFFVPHRHVYGDSWIDMIKGGYGSTVNLGAHSNADGFQSWPALQINGMPTMPTYLTSGYPRIWNRYFRPPTHDEYLMPEDGTYNPDNNGTERAFGKVCCPLPRIFNSPVKSENATAAATADASDDEVSLISLRQAQAKLTQERKREFMARRYTDVLHQVWGTDVNTDADERPTLLMRKSFWLSGYDVDGTDDATLGTYSGKSVDVGRLYVPPKKFAEHGHIWCLALVRFPSVYLHESPRYDHHTGSTAYEIAAVDPAYYSSQPPEQVNVEDHFFSAPLARTEIGIRAYGDEFREGYSFVHNHYNLVDGFPFYQNPNQSTMTKLHTLFIDPDYFDSVFQTTQLAHWQLQMRRDTFVRRHLPKPLTSIFVGTDL